MHPAAAALPVESHPVERGLAELRAVGTMSDGQALDVVQAILLDDARLGDIARASTAEPTKFAAYMLGVQRAASQATYRALKSGVEHAAKNAAMPALKGRPIVRLVGRRIGDFDVPAALIEPYGYRIEDAGVFLDDTQVVNRPVLILGYTRDVDSNEVHAKLAWQAPDHSWCAAPVPRVALQDYRDARKAAPMMPTVTDGQGFTAFVSAFEDVNGATLPTCDVVSRQGWTPDGRGFALGLSMIGESGLTVQAPEDPDVARHVNGRVCRGTVEEWRESVGAMASGYPVIGAAVLVSFASVVLELVGGQGFTLHLGCPPESGKSRAMDAAASVWGRPDDLNSSWNVSAYAASQLMAGHRSLPMFLDDASNIRCDADVQDIIYGVYNGRSPSRGNGHKNVATSSWLLTAVSSGEGPLDGFLGNGGARSRLLTLDGLPFNGDTALRAPELHRLSRTFHGAAGLAFVGWLIRESPAHREEWRRELTELIKTEAYAIDQGAKQLGMKQAKGGGRAAAYVATLALTARLVRDAVGLDLSGALAPCREAAVQTMETTDVGKKAMHDFLSWASSNQARFSDDRTAHPDWAPAQGWAGRRTNSEIAVVPTVLEVALRECGANPTNIIADWKRRAWLRKVDGRWTARRAVGSEDSKTACYLIPIRDVEFALE